MVSRSNKHYGGYLSGIQTALLGIDKTCSAASAFTAVPKDWNAVTCNSKYLGGDSNSAQAALAGVSEIDSTYYELDVVFKDGSVISWSLKISLVT